MRRLRQSNKVVLASFVFLFISITYAVIVTNTQNTFTNNLESENLTFLGNEKINRFFSIQVNTFLENLTFNITGIGFIGVIQNDSFQRSSLGTDWVNTSNVAGGAVGIEENRLSISGPAGGTQFITHIVSSPSNVSFTLNYSVNDASVSSRFLGTNGSNTSFNCDINREGGAPNFNLDCLDGNSVVPVFTVIQNKIHEISFINIYYNNFTYDVFIDNTLYDNGGNHFAFRKNISETLNMSFTKTQQNGRTYIDDFSATGFSLPSNISIEINNKIQFNSTLGFNDTLEVSINVSEINTILENDCVCSECNLTNLDCYIPISFLSKTLGIIEYSNIQSNEIFGLDQCESFNTSAFNFSIRDEITGAQVTANSTFSIDFWIDPTDVNTLISTNFGNDTYPFCKFPSYANITGNIGATLTASGRESSTFSRTTVFLSGIFTAFMLPSSTAIQQVLYIIVDEALSRIEGARMKFQRTINGTLQTTFEGNSDFRGQIVLNQDSDSIYTIELDASGFPLKTFDLQPILTSYTIRLTEGGEDLFSNPYSGFRYKVIPNNNLFNISNDFTTFMFITEGSSLEYWGINLTRHSFECIPTDCSNISTSPTGGNVTVQIKLNTTGRFYTELFFKKTGQELIRINSWPNDATVISVATRSVINLLEEIKQNTSPNVRAILVAGTQITLIAIASFVGIVGFPLVVVSTLIIIFFSLPFINWINPFFGLFMSLGGLIMYVMSQRNG